MVKLDLTLLFDPTDSWQHLYQFDKDFSEFLRTKGLQSELVKTIEGGKSERLYLVEKAPSSLGAVVEGGKPQVGPQKILDDMRNKPVSPQEARFKKGVFVKGRGLIKR